MISWSEDDFHHRNQIKYSKLCYENARINTEGISKTMEYFTIFGGEKIFLLLSVFLKSNENILSYKDKLC